MSLADTIIAMAAAGCSAEQMAEVARQFKQQDQEGLAGRRANDAERQRRRRAKAKEDVTECHVTSRDVTLVTRDPSPSLSPSSSSPPITPLITTPPISPPSENARGARSLAVQAAFDAFWRRWPHKVGKPAAEKAFAKVSGEIEAILIGIDRYIRDKPPDRPWLNPATFLNQRRWEDAPANVSQTFASHSKGWGGLYAELNGYGDGIGQKRIDEAVSLLPRSAVNGAGDRDGDAGGLPGDVVELFASGRG